MRRNPISSTPCRLVGCLAFVGNDIFGFASSAFSPEAKQREAEDMEVDEDDGEVERNPRVVLPPQAAFDPTKCSCSSAQRVF